MTRKDYIVIAEAVAKVVGRNIAWQEREEAYHIAWQEREEAYPGSTNCMAITRSQLVSDIGSQLLYELSHTFKADNARFDRERFAEFFNEKEEGARAEREASF
jgi:hypothetical protein